MMKHTLIFLLLIFTLHAKYFNTNPLIEKGIDPKVLNLAVTIFTQNLYYEIDAHEVIEKNSLTKQQDFMLVYNPFLKYGIDISVKIPSNKIQNYNKSDLKETLDLLMGLQSYLQSERLYKPNTISKVKSFNGEDIFSFAFDETKIPRELKFYKHLQGKLYIKNNQLQKIVVTNTTPFDYDNYHIKSYTKTLLFSKPLVAKGYLIKTIQIDVEGLKDEEKLNLSLKANFFNYKDKDNTPIKLKNGNTITPHSSYKTINVNLDRTLPVFGQEIRKMGYDLPKPFGISLVTMYQQTRFYMDGISLEGEDLSRFFTKESKYENATYANIIRADVWILPFLNFSLLFGGTSTSTEVTIDLNIPGYIIPKTSVGNVNTSSILYGAGATLGGGVGNFFSSVDFQYLYSKTDTAGVETQITVITPIFGYYFQSLGLRAYGGAMYEDLKEELLFTVPLNGEMVSGKIKLRAEKWSGSLGAQYAFTRHWEANILGAYGKDFQNISLVATYRW
jgi:hypothetical protein